ncbi:hypothetical protein [Dyella koreensis]|uniref:Uncharacterized protein n=1 Tax=Dyella koreensis TaxID=311235 RepID=A0ABW8K2G6_9GAMM
MRKGKWLMALGWLLGFPLGLLHATVSPPEQLEWHGKNYNLATQPLEQRYAGEQVRPRFMSAPLVKAGGDRGYIGHWRLEDDRLYLLDIESWLCGEGAVLKTDCRKVTLDDVFGDGTKAPVLAEWFNGDLVLSSQEPVREAAYRPTIRITLKAGKVTHIEMIGNVPSPTSLDGERKGAVRPEGNR